jgi:CRISPR-associated protein Csb2
VEVPADCPIDASDVHWAFSGLDLTDRTTGEVVAILIATTDSAMLDHYGIGDSTPGRLWRSITPVVLPQAAARRRIEPSRKNEDVKAGSERVAEYQRAGAAVKEALRHAGVQQRPLTIRLQREPLEHNGARVEAFAKGTRFSKERLWHLEITFESPIGGPLVIGDGRFLGLGVMSPFLSTEAIYAFEVKSGLAERADPGEIAHATRRAVMARVQDLIGPFEVLPTFFSGHEPKGTRARSSHLAFGFDARAARLLLVPPHALDRRRATWEEGRYLAILERSLDGFDHLRAGPAGDLALARAWVDKDIDPLLAPAHVWQTITPYIVTRHAKLASAEAALAADVRLECSRRGLPRPREVLAIEARGVPGVGLAAQIRLIFAVAIRGPILLGRSRYQGGGLFASASATL